MIDPNRLKDVSAFLDFATSDLALRLRRFYIELRRSDPPTSPPPHFPGFAEDPALTLTVELLKSVLAIPSPTET